MVKELLLQVARPEFAQATEELKSLPPGQAVMRFYARHDAKIDAALTTSGQTLACRAGCAYCCNHKVEARAIEVLEMRAHVAKHFGGDKLRPLMERLRRNAEEARGMSYDEQLATIQACAFLVDNQCSVYSVRPSKCRNFHATDVSGCKQAYDEPNNFEIKDSFVSEVYIAANGSATGFENAVEYAKLDPRAYDLSTAFLEAMKDPGTCLNRFRSGKKTFVKAKVIESTEPGRA